MFDRQAVHDIKAWHNSRHRQPLVVRGARQVGKSTAVALAAQALGVPLYAVNLEQHPTLERQFASFDVDRALFSLSAILGEPITPESKGILFLDEAQATPSAYACLRYFHENAPRLAVVLTGSLLGQVLDNYPSSAPVGRVQHYFMGPVGFSEFLRALGDARLLNALDMTTAQTLDFIPDEIHEKLMERARQYILVGGMPAAVQLAIDTDFDHRAISQRQSDIISAYKADFSKYQSRLDGLRLQGFFEGVLAQVGKQFSHKLAHRIVNETDGDNRLLNSALEQFREAQTVPPSVAFQRGWRPLGRRASDSDLQVSLCRCGIVVGGARVAGAVCDEPAPGAGWRRRACRTICGSTLAPQRPELQAARAPLLASAPDRGPGGGGFSVATGGAGLSG